MNHNQAEFQGRNRQAGSTPAAAAATPAPATAAPATTAPAAAPAAAPTREGEVRTLFVSGVPADVQEREIHLLFRFFPGYEGCTISRPEGKQPLCFASFTEASLAARARDALQGFKFEPSTTYPLRIEFARSNSKVKRLPRDFLEGDFRKRLSVTVTDLTPSYPPYAPQGYPNPFLPWLNNPESTSPQFAFSPYVNAAPAPAAAAAAAAGTSTGKTAAFPITTLFVGNLASDVQRNDLTRLFFLMPGFKELRMTYRNEHPIAFVEFSDVNTALNAMKTLQGAPIGSSRIRIEFAKRKTGEGVAEKRSAPSELDETTDEGASAANANAEDY